MGFDFSCGVEKLLPLQFEIEEIVAAEEERFVSQEAEEEKVVKEVSRLPRKVEDKQTFEAVEDKNDFEAAEAGRSVFEGAKEEEDSTEDCFLDVRLKSEGEFAVVKDECLSIQEPKEERFGTAEFVAVKEEKSVVQVVSEEEQKVFTSYAMAVKKEQVSSISVQDFLCGRRSEGGNQCMWTPRTSPKAVECWMAPVKPRRRNSGRVLREEPAWVSSLRDGALKLMVDEYAELTISPLRSCPKFENIPDESSEGYNMGQLEDTMRGLLVSEGDQFVTSPLRFCPNFERTSDDEWKNTCKMGVDFVSQQPMIVPALVWH